MSASTRWIGEVGYDTITGELQFRCCAVADERMMETLLADIKAARAELRRCERILNDIRDVLDDFDADAESIEAGVRHSMWDWDPEAQAQPEDNSRAGISTKH
jgi:hypothetical protein